MNKHYSKLAVIAVLVAAVFAAAWLSNIRAAGTADLNGDGKVDVTDLSIILSNYGKQTATGDINGDGSVTIIDLSMLLTAFGKPVTPSPTPPPAPQYYTAVTGGAWGPNWGHGANDVGSIGAKYVRTGFGIGTSTSTIDAAVAAYHAKGTSMILLADFHSRIPTTAEAQSVATWAARYGAGGSYWVGKSNPRPVKWIEFGNETSYNYQWTDNSTAAKQQRARDYAQRYKEARTAMNGAGSVASSVGLLYIADGNVSDWLSQGFTQVPGLAGMVASAGGGWVVHPYAPLTQPVDSSGTVAWPSDRTFPNIMNSVISDLAARGVTAGPSSPLFITEYGISSDDGRTLQDNYGWPRNMTLAQAGAAIQAIENSVRTTYAGKVRLFTVYSDRDLEEPGASTDREKYFGSLRRNNWALTGGEKGAYSTAVRSIMARGAL